MANEGRIAGSGIHVLAQGEVNKGTVAGSGIHVLAQGEVNKGTIAGCGIHVLVLGPHPGEGNPYQGATLQGFFANFQGSSLSLWPG